MEILKWPQMEHVVSALALIKRLTVTATHRYRQADTGLTRAQRRRARRIMNAF